MKAIQDLKQLFYSKHAEESVVKVAAQTGTGTFPIWVPASLMHVDIFSIAIGFQTGTNTDDAVAILQRYHGGVWENLARLGSKKDRYIDFHHTFVGHVDTDIGDGIAARLQMVVTGTDIDMVANVIVEGVEEA